MRKRSKLELPSHSTVAAYLALFVAIGGSAYAAVNLPKNSVGTRELKKKSVGTTQLKGNAVTKNKIKKNSVVTHKIRGGSVVRNKIKNDSINSAKIADGTVTGSDINASSTPFGRIVHEARGSVAQGLPNESTLVYPLQNNVYTQEPGRDDVYYGAVDLTFLPTCAPPRSAHGFIVIDPANPAEPDETNVVGFGVVEDKAGGQVNARINIGPYLGSVRFQNDVPVNHSLFLGTEVECKAGAGAIANSGGIDVVGVK